MHIKRLQLEGFRNYKKEETGFHKNINIIVGENAQGKTNLLESIYFTSFGKSFRTSRDKEMIGFGEDFCRVIAEYDRAGETENVDVALARDGRKAARIDGRDIERIAELINDHYCVIFSPEDMKIVKDEPEKRRAFIDRELCQLSVSYFNALTKYKKTLMQKNAYLKNEHVDENMLDVWDENLGIYGARIIKKRKEFIDVLSGVSREIHTNITEGKEDPNIDYDPSIPYEKDEDAIKDVMIDMLKESREKDIIHGNTSKGPHKDDIEIKIEGKSTRRFGSQGQQRTAALSLKLAEIEIIKKEKGDYPILLLDDVFSELDEGRQRYLIDYLEMMQVFVTAAQMPQRVVNSFPDSKTITIKEGKIIS